MNTALPSKAVTALGVALITLLTVAPAGAQPPTKLVFGTDWFAEAEHGG